MSYVLGIDPGKNGGIAKINAHDGGTLEAWGMPKTEKAAAELIFNLSKGAMLVAIERVTGWIPNARAGRMPMSRMFVMGWWTGGPIFAAHAAGAEVKLVMAFKWQKDLGVLSKGDKKALAEHAHRLTGYKVKQQCADAALIALWASKKAALSCFLSAE